MKKQNWRKAMRWAVGIVLVGFAAVFFNALYGNPISGFLARVSAQQYLNREYSHLDVEIERTGYNFKDGNYYAKIISPTSVDTHFSVYLSPLGKVYRDTYDSVSEGFNTWERLNQGYNELVDGVLESPAFPYDTHIVIGDLMGKHDDYPWTENYALPREGLILDGEYDIRALGEQHGTITLYIYESEITYERGAEILADVADILEKENVPFHAMNFVLRKPKDPDNPERDGVQLYLLDFLSSDIAGEGLEERVRLGHERAMEYFGEENKIE